MLSILVHTRDEHGAISHWASFKSIQDAVAVVQFISAGDDNEYIISRYEAQYELPERIIVKFKGGERSAAD